MHRSEEAGCTLGRVTRLSSTPPSSMHSGGEVIEVIGQGVREHYRIRWQDGHESVCFPGPDARVVSAG